MTARRILRDDRGTTLVELAIVLPVFLLLLFVLIDFGRMGYDYVMAQKAMQKAARLAVVRPPACAGVPNFNTRGAVPVGTTPQPYGTACKSGATICANPGTVTCTGAAGNATAAEIWTAIDPLMPPGATVANLSFTYAFNADLGFLGGPYTPMVTVRITGLNYTFISPLGGLMTLAGSGTTLAAMRAFPALPVSLPAEDLAAGEAG